MAQPQPTPLDEMLDNLIRDLHARAHASDASALLVMLHAMALVLADTRRIVGRPVASMMEDPNRTKSERPRTFAQPFAEAPPPTLRDMADEQARMQLRAQARREAAGVRVDPPRPAVRDRVEGPVDACVELVDAFVRGYKGQTAPEDPLLDKDRAELAQALTDLEATKRLLAAADRRIERLKGACEDQAVQIMLLRGEAAQHEKEARPTADIEEARDERHAAVEALAAAERQFADLRTSLRTAMGLPANALDSVIVGRVRECGALMAQATTTIERCRQALAIATGMEGPGGMALPDLVERAGMRIAGLLEEYAKARDAAWAILHPNTALAGDRSLFHLIEDVAEQVMATWGLLMSPPDDRPRHVPDEVLLGDAVAHVFGWYQSQIGARAEQLRDERARWARIQPLIKALHAVENWPRFVSATERQKLAAFVDRIERWHSATAPDGREVLAAVDRVTEGSPSAWAVRTLINAFEAWQKSEADALDESEGVVEPPGQPDDPGVDPGVAEALDEKPDGRAEERAAIVSYLRRCAADCETEWTKRGPNAELGLAGCEAIGEAADDIERGAHVAALDDTRGRAPSTDLTGCDV